METTISKNEIIRKLDDLSDLIGNTPLIKLENISIDNEIRIFAKAEWIQFGGSTKIRSAYNIIRHAILTNVLDQNRTLLDATTENMAIAYATIAARMNIPVLLCIPDTSSQYSKDILKSLGTDIHLIGIDNNFENLKDAAFKIYTKNPDKYYFANQLLNENYWKAHYYTTAEEIIEQTNGEVTHFISGIGATGTFTGVGKRLKNYNRRMVVVSIFPEESEKKWGIIDTSRNTSFYDNQLIDYEIPVSLKESEQIAKEIAKKEGLVLSRSSAANILGAIKIAREINMGTIVTILPNC